MIDFHRAKELLLPILIARGYKEDKAKSSRGHKVMSDGKTKLILKPNRASGVYDYYYNVNDNSDWGDTMKFLARELCLASDTRNLTHDHYKKIEEELERVGREAIVSTPLYNSSSSEIPFQYDKVKTTPLGKLEFPNQSKIGGIVPIATQYMLKQRGLADPKIFSDDFKESLSIIHQVGQNGKEYHNLLFLWRDAQQTIKGGQYKFMKEGKCVKHFLINSERGKSLWYSNPINKRGLLITEDPFDALAHHLLYPELDYAYACTGGSVSPPQVAIIHALAKQHNLPLVLGNDHDIAGQLANLKILDINNKLHLQHDKKTENIRVALKSNGSVLFEDVDHSLFYNYVQDCATQRGVNLILPDQGKDWNDALQLQQKGVAQSLLLSQAAQMKYTAPSKHLDLENNHHYLPTV